MENVIERFDKWDVRIKLIDVNNELIKTPIDEIENIENIIKSLSICITSYESVKQIITYQNSKDETEIFENIMTEPVDKMLHIPYNSSDFIFFKEYDKIDDFFALFISIFQFKVIKSNIDLEIYITYGMDDKEIIFDSEFLKLIFQTFRGNIFLYGNTKTIWNIPNGEISLSSLNIERGNIGLNRVSIFKIDFFELNHLDIWGLNDIPELPDQLIFYTKNTSFLRNINILNSIRIGISEEFINQFKWLNSSLTLENIGIDFTTKSDKDKKYDHIIKIDNYNTVNLIQIDILKEMDKLIPFKFERCPNVNIMKFNDLYRASDKGIPELQFKNVSNLKINDFKVFSNNTNSKSNGVISIFDTEQGEKLSFNNINIYNNDFLTISSSFFQSIDISNLNITSNQNIFNLNSFSNYIENFNIYKSDIEAKNFNLDSLKNVFIHKTRIKMNTDFNSNVLNLLISESNITSSKNIYLNTYGFEVNETEKGKVSLNESNITSSENIEITSKRENSEFILNKTHLKCKNFNDKDFIRVSLKESELSISEGLFESEFYQLKNLTFYTKNIYKYEKAFIFKGEITGSIIVKYGPNNVKNFPLALIREEMDPEMIHKIDFILEGNDAGLMNVRLDLINSCTNFIYKSNGNTNANINLYIKDDSKEQYFYKLGLYHLIENKTDLINIYLKSTSMENLNNTKYIDGNTELDEEKFNYGIQ